MDIERFFGRITLMENKISLNILFFFTVFLLAIIIILILYYPEKQSQACFKEYCFNIELAVTDKERNRGLMFREYLAFNESMLFVFPEEGEYPFWMKNTLIPLDIIWINQEKEVVFIKENFQPCENEYSCPLVRPDKNAKYVLEVNEGIVEKIGLEVGDKILLFVE